MAHSFIDLFCIFLVFFCDLFFDLFSAAAMKNRKIQLIDPLPKSTKQKKAKCVSVSPENLRDAYTQIFHLQNLVNEHIPSLVTDIQNKADEIKKMKILYKLKDEELYKCQTK